jgi:aspartate/methionine/tyrosine aminotransferase
MQFAHRTQHVAPFLAMEFGKRAAELEAQGHAVIRLNLGEPDFGPPPAVRKALQDLMEAGDTSYTAALGLPALREAIAQHHERVHGQALDPARVVVTAGASAALLLVCAALVNEGDEWLVGDPSYPCNRHFLASFGAQVKLIPTDASSRFQLSSSAVREHWTPRTKGLLVATPSNPTGTSVPTAELAALCQFAAEQKAWRVVDEIYLELSHPPEAPPPPSVLALDDGAFVINSFSKTFGMTGWRLGWAVLPPEAVPVVERLAQNYFICPSSPAQQAALACFTPESLAVVAERRLELAHRRTLVLEGLARIGLPVPVPPDGAFYVYIDIQHTGLDAMRFCERLLQEEHVALTPGLDFGPALGGSHVRLSFAASMAALQEALLRVERFVSRLS